MWMRLDRYYWCNLVSFSAAINEQWAACDVPGGIDLGANTRVGHADTQGGT